MKKISVSLVTFLSLNLSAQEVLSYQKPSESILNLADFQRPPVVLMDSKKDWLLLCYRDTYKTLADLSQPEMRLAGLRVNPVTNIGSNVRYLNNLKLRRRDSTTEIQVKGLPSNPRIAYLSWSPDERKIAFTHTTPTGVELYVVDIATATAKRMIEGKLNANLGKPYQWYQDSSALLISVLLKDRPALIDSSKDLPTGPIVSTSDGKVSQNRTYQDLLKNPQDEKNFDILASSQLYKLPLYGQPILLKPKGIYTEMSFSPDGKYLLLSSLHRPYSYIVPLSRFPVSTSVYTSLGKEVKKLNEVPLTEVMPKGFSATRVGKRAMMWRPDQPATVVYAEALDGGDPAQKAEFRDEVFSWEAPFNQNPKSLIKLGQRYAGISFSDDKYAIVSDAWYDTRNTRSFLLNLQDGTSRKLEDRNSQDIYSDPGNFVTVLNQFNREVIDVEDDKALLLGEGFSKDGQKPFVDELNLKDLSKKRLYTTQINDAKEEIIDVLDRKKGDFLVMRQSPKDYPNYLTRNIQTGATTPVTKFANPFASLGNIYKEVIKYKRADGTELSGTLYLPAGYDRQTKKQKLPLLVWAYPTEYKNKATAGQTNQNPYDFTYPSYGSFIYWVTKGYAVLDDAAFPIIGEGTTEPNDSFIQQLVDNGRAAVDAVDALGYIDRNKVAVGGHSYGAFMTANLLTHSKDFACGIARSGAYNRTLTPFGFQSEQRNYWDVPQLYNQMSPFMNADKMKRPLLLIHGDADNNPGTFTLQTERYFQALKNLGAPVRMVLLPKESHGYAAKESVLHTLWEQEEFLDKCLKK